MPCSKHTLYANLGFVGLSLCACQFDKGAETAESAETAETGEQAPIIDITPDLPARDDDPESTIGALESTPGRSCVDILNRNPDGGDGVWWIDPDGDGAGAYQVACDQTTDGGGWTLVMVTSDDEQTTWTWNDRHLLDTDTRLVGALASRDHDFKSAALHDLPMSDLLFVHHPSEIWASYHAVSDGSGAFGDAITSAGPPTCYDQDADGYEMSAGTLTLTGDLCTTRLFLNPADWDGPPMAAWGLASGSRWI